MSGTPTQRLAPFGAVYAAYFAAMGLFSPYYPLWLQHLGFTTFAIGLFAALQSATRVVAPYGWGWLADHGGRRAVLVRWASACSAAAALAMAIVGEQGAAIALAMAALYLANGAILPITESMMLAAVHGRHGLDAVRYGRTRVWGSVGFAVAAAAGGPVLEALGVRSLPWLTAALFAATVLAASGLPSAGPVSHEHGPPVSVAPVLRRPEVRWFFAGTMLTVLAHTALYAFFSLYIDSLGLGKTVVGIAWGVAVLAEIAFFATQGRWMAWAVDLKWLQVVGWVAAARFALTAAAGHWLALLLLVQVSHAITFAAHHSACTSVIGRHFPGRLRGRGAALYSTLGYGVPGVVGGMAGGALVQRYGLESVFWAASLAGVAAALCYRRAEQARARPG